MLTPLLIGCGLLLVASSLLGRGLTAEYRWVPAGVGLLLLLQTGVLVQQQAPPATINPPQAEPMMIPPVTPLNSKHAQAWSEAPPAVRQVTAIQWLKELRLRGAFVLPIRSESEYAQWGAALSRCLDLHTVAPDTDLLRLAESQCVPKLKHYRYGSGPKP